MSIDELYHPTTMCTDCLDAWETLNRWWCGTHHRTILSGDLPCPQYRGRGTIGSRGAPVKSKEQLQAENASLTGYIPKLALLSEETKKKKKKGTTTTTKKRI